MSSRQYLADVSVRHAVFIQRYGGGQSKRAEKLLLSLFNKIEKRLNSETDYIKIGRLQAVQRDISTLASASFNDISAFIHKSNTDLLYQDALFNVELYTRAIDTDFVMPSDKQLEIGLKNKTMGLEGGEKLTVDEAVGKFSRAKQKQIKDTIKHGILLGDSTDNIVKELSTTIKSLQNRQLEALVRTATNHAATVARLEVMEANSDVLLGYRWLSTLDGRTTLICAGRDNKLYALDSGITTPAHWNCVLGDTLITSASGVSASFKRIFKGEVITIQTVAGNKLTLTPNHPVLTSSGWKPAHLLTVGDECFNQVACKGIGGVNGDNNHSFERVEQIHESLLRSCDMLPKKVPVSSPDFHGDGIDNEIAEICTASNLSAVRNIGIVQHPRDSIFKRGYMMPVNATFKSFRHPTFFLKSSLSPGGGYIGIFRELLNLFRRGLIHSCLLLFRPVPDMDTVIQQDTLDGTWTDTDQLRNSPDTYAGGVFLDDVVSVKRGYFNGHVYNLQTKDHCYSANGIITHNCRSTLIPEVKPEYDIGSDLTGERFARDKDGNRENVSDKVTYGGWLKRQPKEFQNEVLGINRAKLFRSGKVKIENFTGDDGKTLTLEQLAATHNL